MSTVCTTKLSSRGQVVIPQSIREELGLSDGEVLAVTAVGEGVLLQKVSIPSRDEMWQRWAKLHKEGRKIVKRLKIREKDIVDIIHARRRSKE